MKLWQAFILLFLVILSAIEWTIGIADLLESLGKKAAKKRK